MLPATRPRNRGQRQWHRRLQSGTVDRRQCRWAQAAENQIRAQFTLRVNSLGGLFSRFAPDSVGGKPARALRDCFEFKSVFAHRVLDRSIVETLSLSHSCLPTFLMKIPAPRDIAISA
jgi:hypothetical protein